MKFVIVDRASRDELFGMDVDELRPLVDDLRRALEPAVLEAQRPGLFRSTMPDRKAETALHEAYHDGLSALKYLHHAMTSSGG